MGNDTKEAEEAKEEPTTKETEAPEAKPEDVGNAKEEDAATTEAVTTVEDATKDVASKEDGPTDMETNETEEKEAPPEEAAAGSAEHARIDDPVEPPARNAPKVKAPAPEDAAEGETSAVLPVDSNSILSRLFDPDRKQKPALWSHIKLVAPGPADQPPPGHLKWRSKDAIAAYCLKCKKQFTYTKGTSKTISRHMMAYHGMITTSGEMAEDGDTPVKKRGLDGARSAEPPLKKRKPDLGKVVSPSQLLLKWLIGSFRPFSVVEDPGLNEFIKSCSSETLPSTADMLRLALDQSSKVTLELKSHLRACQGYNLGCEQFDFNGETYYAVKVAFCNNNFELIPFTLAVKTGSDCASTIKETLAEFDLNIDKITSVTLRNVDTSVDLELEGCPKTDYIYDVLHKMDTLLVEALDKGDVGSLLTKIRKHVGESCGFVRNGDAFARSSPEFGNSIVGVHQLLQRFESPPSDVDTEATKESDKWSPTSNEQYMTKVLSTILKPFYDATTTLSGEKFPTVGLAVPVFRRIQDVLGKTDLKETPTDEVDEATLKSMEDFLKALAESFSTAFPSILGSGHPLMWTIPLDPRLIHMRGLSDEEKESVTKVLVEKLQKQKLEQGVSGTDETETAEEGSKKQESSTMGGIFWGEDEVDKGSSEGAVAFAQAIVDRYFNTVRSHRRIDDPLDWWKSNQEQFPELCQMAKVWFGSSATIEAMSDDRKNYSGENFSLVAFLHENMDLPTYFPYGATVSV